VNQTQTIVLRLDLATAAIRADAQVLSAAEQERAARFRFETDRRRFIAARARLRELLAVRLGSSPAAVRLVYGTDGKPELADHALQFNLSHSGDVAAFAFSRDSRIGIDIEEIRPVPEADAIAASMFSRGERVWYAALPPGEKLRGFFRCWTRREAFLKMLGKGLLGPRSRTACRIEKLPAMPGFIGAVAYGGRGLA